MKQGTLFYDPVAERMDFEYAIETYYGSLHCGEGFDAYINQNPSPWEDENYQWEHVSIEYDHKNQRWYFPQHPLIDLTGIRIRMK